MHAPLMVEGNAQLLHEVLYADEPSHVGAPRADVHTASRLGPPQRLSF